MEIKNSYLMWIGSEHYPTFKDWETEAMDRGVSKRLPTVGLAGKLMEPGTAIFVAHNEGRYHECLDCMGMIECPGCRRRATELDRLKAAEEKAREFKNLKGRYGRVRRAGDRLIAAMTQPCEDCEKDDGQGTLERGTGGRVQYALGVYGDYRTYTYWLHRPKAFAEGSGETIESQVTSKEICEACGGTGRRPDAMVYGLLVPEGIEYITKDDDTEAFKEDLAARGIRVVTTLELRAEGKRGCGYRLPGGYYVVTSTEGYREYNAKIVAELVAKGVEISGAADLSGIFVKFIEPVEVAVKKFRGIKRWALDVEAEAEAEMILDAME